MTKLEHVKEYFESQGFVAHYRNYFSENVGLFVTTEQKTTSEFKYFERSVFVYPDENKRWTTRITPHGKGHSVSHFDSLQQAAEFAERLLGNL